MTALLFQLVSLALFLSALIGLNFVSTESIKKLMQMLQKTFASIPWLKRPMELLTPKGNKTFFLAIIMAFLFVAGYDLNVFGDFSDFDNVNPVLLDLMHMALVSYGSNLVNDRQKK